MRPKSTGRDLPPRMLRRTKRLKSGDVWHSYYYNGRDEDGSRKEIPLGNDLNEAKRKWAELECKPAPVETGLMKHVFDRYEKDIIPTKAPRTQKDNLEALRQLRPTFDLAPIDAITPQHIAQYRDKRSAKVRANREIALFSHIYNIAREWGYTAKENPFYFVLAISCISVAIMCPIMSLIATILFKHAGRELIAVWVQTTVINFPMAFFLQIFYASCHSWHAQFTPSIHVYGGICLFD